MSRRLFPRWGQALSALPDPRASDQCDYPREALCEAVMMMYEGRLAARRQIRYRLHTALVRERLSRRCGQALTAVPHGDTAARYLAMVPPPAMQRVPQSMVRDLLVARRLEPLRFLGRYYLLTCDLSGHLYLGDHASAFTEGCLTQTHSDGRTLYYRPVCEAKLVTHSGLALSIGSEFVENPPGFTRKHGDPQDSELPAAQRLFPRVKAAFPGLAFCALLDARYCNETGFALCEANHWRFIITLQDGSIPSVWQEFQTLRSLTPGNQHRLIAPDGIEYRYTWVNAIAYGERTLNVLECAWTDAEGEHRFVWVTDLPIHARNCEALAHQGGRQRWKIENNGFRTQKHGGFAMEHAYAKNVVTAKNFYLLLQAAHIRSQMLECYCKGKQAVQRAFGSLRNLAAALLESLRRDPIPEPETLHRFMTEPIHIRLNTS